jgi:DNA-binding MarR family transcriptional regulator
METHFADIGELLAQAARLWTQALSRRLRDLGVLPGQAAVLRLLWEEDGRTQAELRRLAGVEQPTMAKTLQRMVRDGLVRREPDPDDRRRRRVLLAPRAQELRAAVGLAEQELEATALAGFTGEEQERLARLLTALGSGLKTDLNEGPLVLVDVVSEA